MSKIKSKDNSDKKYDEYEYLETPGKKKYIKSKFKKNTMKKKKFNKQSDYRKRANRKK